MEKQKNNTGGKMCALCNEKWTLILLLYTNAEKKKLMYHFLWEQQWSVKLSAGNPGGVLLSLLLLTDLVCNKNTLLTHSPCSSSITV